MKNEDFKKGEIIIYQTSKKEVDLRVRLEEESVWLTQAQIAELFGTKRPAITKHLNNILKSGELNEKAVCSILEHTASDKKAYKTKFYNLDMVLSVGYRVNSKQATQFRIWATKILKQHVLDGYTINQERLREANKKFVELQETVAFLHEKSRKTQLKGQESEILELLADYSKTLTILERYDKSELKSPKGKKAKFVLNYEQTRRVVGELRKELVAKKEAGDLFGVERGGEFEGIIKNLYQTFRGKELYRNIEEKAAHLLYLIIKDHPLSDGNKRTAAFLFVYFLDKNNYLYRKSGERKINDNALTALALLIAESDPQEKETLVKIVINLIAE